MLEPDGLIDGQDMRKYIEMPHRIHHFMLMMRSLFVHNNPLYGMQCKNIWGLAAAGYQRMQLFQNSETCSGMSGMSGRN